MAHRLILVITALLVLSTTTYADDFGARFSNNPPAAFSDPTKPGTNVNEFMDDMNDIAEKIQNISPAAGDNTDNPSTNSEIKNTVEDSEPNSPPKE